MEGDRGSHTKPRQVETPSEQRRWAADWSSPRCDENETSIKTAEQGWPVRADLTAPQNKVRLRSLFSCCAVHAQTPYSRYNNRHSSQTLL